MNNKFEEYTAVNAETPTLYGDDAKAVLNELKNNKCSKETLEKGKRLVDFYKKFEK